MVTATQIAGDAPAIHLTDACRALGMPVVLVKAWEATGVRLLDHGDHLSVRRFTQLALVDEYGKLGVDPFVAARWALGFTDSANGSRTPGELFARDDTFLIAKAGKQIAIAVPGEVYYAEPPASAVVLHMDPIMARVRAALAASR